MHAADISRADPHSSGGGAPYKLVSRPGDLEVEAEAPCQLAGLLGGRLVVRLRWLGWHDDACGRDGGAVGRRERAAGKWAEGAGGARGQPFAGAQPRAGAQTL